MYFYTKLSLEFPYNLHVTSNRVWKFRYLSASLSDNHREKTERRCQLSLALATGRMGYPAKKAKSDNIDKTDT